MGVLYIILTTMIWGFIPILVKIILVVFNPLTIVFVRFSLACIFFFLLWIIRGRKGSFLLNWRNPWLLLGGSALSLNYILFTLGVKETTAGSASLLVQSQIIFLILWGHLLLRERIDWLKGIGMLITLAGLFIVIWSEDSLAEMFASRYFWGNILVAISGLFWSFYGLSNKKLGENRRTTEILPSVFLLGVIITAIPTYLKLEFYISPTGRDIIILIALGVIGTGLSYLLLSEGIKRLNASTAGVMTSLAPVFTLLSANIFLGEEITTRIIIGTILILLGIVVIIYDDNYQLKLGEQKLEVEAYK